MTVVTITANSTGTYAGCEDTFLDVGNPTTNYSTDTVLLASAYNDNYVLLKFSGLSNIPSNATVSAVTVRLKKALIFSVPPIAGNTIFIRLLRNWVETQATWDIYSTGNNWESGGARGASDVAASGPAIAHGAGVGYVDLSDAALVTDVQNWINGTNPNYGWRISDSADYINYESSNATDGSRPELVVTYTTPGGEATPTGVSSASDSGIVIAQGRPYPPYTITRVTG